MKYRKIILLSIISSSYLVANSGWRIAEQSANSVALGGAYVAHTEEAESAYFNPANMSFNTDTNSFSASLMYMYFPSIHYNDNRSSAYNGDSEKEHFVLPTLFYTSKDYNGFRFGMSITNPGWITRRWNDPYPKVYSEEFTLKITELNPVVSYALTPTLSIAAGVRALYSDYTVKTDASYIGANIQSDIDGNSWSFGYNFALTYRPIEKLSLAMTYRSKIDLEEEGNAKLYMNNSIAYDGGVDVTLPLPAVFSLAAAYEFDTKTIVEIEFDRTFWSSYKTLDFEYAKPLPPSLQPIFDRPVSKNWSDTDTVRLGVTQEINEDFNMMLGAGYDQNDDNDKKINSDGWFLSLGGSYKIDDTQNITLGYLYNNKEDQTIINSNTKGLNGTFSSPSTHLVSFSYSINF